VLVECSSHNVVEVTFVYIVEKRRIRMPTGCGSAKLACLTAPWAYQRQQLDLTGTKDAAKTCLIHVCLSGLPVRIFIVFMIQYILFGLPNKDR